jgi:hypothetical protein
MIYTVHVPRDAYDPLAGAERARFIRDGFSWSAFIFGPLWFVWQRSVTGLVLNLILLGAALLLYRGAGLPLPALPALLFLLALFIGFEGTNLVRWSADRKRYRCVDVVSALTLEEAEHQFLRRWTRRPAPVTATAAVSAGGYSPLGLFPDENG